MPKSPRSSKSPDVEFQGNARRSFAKKAGSRLRKKKQASASRRQFLRGAGLAAAAAMIPRPVKAAFNVKQSWQKAVVLLAPEQLESYSASLDTTGWQSQGDVYNWCWAATIYNLSTYSLIGSPYPTSAPQCNLVDSVLGTICSDFNPGHECCEDDVVDDGYCNQYGGVSVAWCQAGAPDCCYGGPMNFDDLANYVYNTGPVVAYIGACLTGEGGGPNSGGSGSCNWGNSCEYMPCTSSNPLGFGHYPTIVGYSTDDDDDEYLTAFDPWSSDGLGIVTYDTFPEGNTWPNTAPANGSYTGYLGSVDWWDSIGYGCCFDC
jgi:hypothetical protein